MPDNILSRSVSCPTISGSQPRSVDLSKQDGAELLIRSSSTDGMSTDVPSTDTDTSQASTPEEGVLLTKLMPSTSDKFCTEELRCLTDKATDSFSTTSETERFETPPEINTFKTLFTERFETPCEKDDTSTKTQVQFELDDIDEYSQVDVKEILSTPFSEDFFTPRSSLSSPYNINPQFQFDDFAEYSPVDPKKILMEEFDKLRKMVDCTQSGINPFDVSKKVFFDVAPPPIYESLFSFVFECLNKNDVDVEYYAEDLKNLFASYNSHPKKKGDKIESIEMRILKHLRKTVSEMQVYK